MKPGTLQGCMKTCILIILFPVRCFGCGDYGSWWLKIYRLLPVYFWFGVVACLHPSVLSFVNGLILGLFWLTELAANTCYLCLCKRSWNEWSQSERCICKIVPLAVEWCEVQNPRSRCWPSGTIKSWSKLGYRAWIFFLPRSFDPDSGQWHSHTDETWDSARLYEDLHFDHFVSCALLWLWRLWFMMIKDFPAAAS